MFNDFDIDFQYIYLPLRCYPANEEDIEKVFGLKKIADSEYIHKETKLKYYETDLHDFGWGPELGYVLHKEFSFDDLIKLAFCNPSIEGLRANQHFGAIALIIKGSKFQKSFVDDLVFFLKNNLEQFNKEQLKRIAFFLFVGPDELIPDYWYTSLLEKNKEWDTIKESLLIKIRENK